MSSDLVLHFYQVSSKYSKEYSSYRVDKKFYKDALSPKNKMFPLRLVVCVCGGVGGAGGVEGWGGEQTARVLFIFCNTLSLYD